MKGLESIKQEINLKLWEGCKLEAYKCPSGYYSIGYGNRFYADGTAVKKGDKLTSYNDANILLEHHLRVIRNKIHEASKVQLYNYQLDALVLFSYNLGLACLYRSTLWKKIQAEEKVSIYNFTDYSNYRKNGIMVLSKALYKRRFAEWERWNGLDNKHTI